jgi:FAD-linked oxidoreductase
MHALQTARADVWSNWSGGVTAAPVLILAPRSEEELAAALVNAPGPIRPAGSGHSFTPLCESTGTLVDLRHLSGVISADPASGEAWVRAGTPVWALGPALHAHGLALPNQGDIDRQTIAGAVSTGTHGTGLTLGNLSSLVTGVTLVTHTGLVLTLDRDNDRQAFEAARLSLGALGVITRLRLKLVASYGLTEASYALDAGEALSRLGELAAAHRHFEFFWFPYADKVVVKTLDVAPAPPPAPPADAEKMFARGERRSGEENLFESACRAVRWAPFLSAMLHRRFTASMAASETRPGRVRWSFETFASARTVRFNEMEYAVPRAAAAETMRTLVARIRKDRLPTAFPIEFRFVKGDDVWLSPASGGDVATISVHQYARMDQSRYFNACEAVFRAHGGRPHWGKMHGLTAEQLGALYPRLGDFNRVRGRLDPDGRMLTPYLRGLLGA